jgi:hypothetical protein
MCVCKLGRCDNGGVLIELRLEKGLNNKEKSKIS